MASEISAPGGDRTGQRRRAGRRRAGRRPSAAARPSGASSASALTDPAGRLGRAQGQVGPDPGERAAVGGRHPGDVQRAQRQPGDEQRDARARRTPPPRGRGSRRCRRPNLDAARPPRRGVRQDRFRASPPGLTREWHSATVPGPRQRRPGTSQDGRTSRRRSSAVGDRRSGRAAPGVPGRERDLRRCTGSGAARRCPGRRGPPSRRRRRPRRVRERADELGQGVRRRGRPGRLLSRRVSAGSSAARGPLTVQAAGTSVRVAGLPLAAAGVAGQLVQQRPGRPATRRWASAVPSATRTERSTVTSCEAHSRNTWTGTPAAVAWSRCPAPTARTAPATARARSPSAPTWPGSRSRRAARPAAATASPATRARAAPAYVRHAQPGPVVTPRTVIVASPSSCRAPSRPLAVRPPRSAPTASRGSRRVNTAPPSGSWRR